MPIRTFLALEIPDYAIHKIIELRDLSLGLLPGIKWEPREKLHITLKFLGDTDEEDIDRIICSIEEIIKGHDELELSFSGFGVFSKGGEPKILWAGINKSLPLDRLVSDIDSVLKLYGVPEDKRSYNPHITLLRIKNSSHLRKLLTLTKAEIPFTEFTTGKISFYESRLLSQGSVYNLIKFFNLKN
jgi:RNA 2',3'-cyclic 3'-phosphodiesterase